MNNIQMEKYDVIRNIIDIVCDFNKTRPDILIKRNRKRELVQVRQIIYYFLDKYKKIHKASYTKIASNFNQDHATVLYSIKHINDLLEFDKMLKKQVEYMDKKIWLMLKTYDEDNITVEILFKNDTLKIDQVNIMVDGEVTVYEGEEALNIAAMISRDSIGIKLLVNEIKNKQYEGLIKC